MALRRTVLATACVAMMFVGCQSRLKQERTVTVKAGGTHVIYVDGPTYEQRVGIDFRASSPIDVFVCLKTDEGAVAEAAERNQAAPKALAVAKKSEAQALEVTIPKKEEFVIILVGGAKDSDVTVSIAGK